jgi:phosphoglycerate kinase
MKKIPSTLKNKRVFLRVDFNVPVKKGKVMDNYKMSRAYPTIKLLLKQKNQIIIASHLGRPEGKVIKEMSLKPVFNHFKKDYPKVKVSFISDYSKVDSCKSQIIILENLRFYQEEYDNDKTFAKLLSLMADVYVNEAFAFCHRPTASMVAITKYLPSYAGGNLIHEEKYLENALRPKKPAILIIGGSKLETKEPVVKKFLPKYDNILIGGILANTFLSAKGYTLGSSLGLDKSDVQKAKKMLKSKKIILPIDVIVTDKKTKKKVRVVQLESEKQICNKNEMVLDIGPQTATFYASLIKKSKTVVWNGPMGYFEDEKFRNGSLSIARAIASSKTTSIAGGGETILIINMSKTEKRFSFISTGGGAMLEYLSGKTLPGLKSLK